MTRKGFSFADSPAQRATRTLPHKPFEGAIAKAAPAATAVVAAATKQAA